MVSSRLPKRAVLLPRDSYRLVLSAFPGLKKSERLRAVEFRLPELYPGSMEDILWESRLLPGTSGAVLSVLVSRREMEEIRGPHPEAVMYVPHPSLHRPWVPPPGAKPGAGIQRIPERQPCPGYGRQLPPLLPARGHWHTGSILGLTKTAGVSVPPPAAATRIQKSIKGYCGAL